MTGKLIFLNGTSSAGKTTLALALQSRLSEPYLHIGLDQFRDGMPPRYRGLNSPPDTSGFCGLNVVPVEDQGKLVTRIRFGDMGLKMLAGMRRAMAAMAKVGNNVIIDDILMQEDFLDDYLEVMQALPVYLVGVRCDLATVSKREARRPGRFPGTATYQYTRVHAHGDYDVEVDTAAFSPAKCADKVAGFVTSRQPGAFRRLRNRKSLTPDQTAAEVSR